MQIDHGASQDARRRRGPLGAGAIVALVLFFLLVLLLRHDWWNWHTAEPLLLGFIPVGLWWQMLVSLGASALMATLVRVAWPDHLEQLATGRGGAAESPPPRDGPGQGA